MTKKLITYHAKHERHTNSNTSRLESKILHIRVILFVYLLNIRLRAFKRENKYF